MGNFDKNLRKNEKEVIKKMGKGGDERGTRLEPYHKLKKVNVRDLDELLDEEDYEDENFS